MFTVAGPVGRLLTSLAVAVYCFGKWDFASSLIVPQWSTGRWLIFVDFLTFGRRCGSRLFIPNPNLSITDPGSSVEKVPDPDPHQRIFVFLIQKSVLRSWKQFWIRIRIRIHNTAWKYDPGCFIPDPKSEFFPSRIKRPKKHRIPDPRCHCFRCFNFFHVLLLLIPYSYFQRTDLSILYPNSYERVIKMWLNYRVRTIN